MDIMNKTKETHIQNGLRHYNCEINYHLKSAFLPLIWITLIMALVQSYMYP